MMTRHIVDIWVRNRPAVKLSTCSNLPHNPHLPVQAAVAVQSWLAPPPAGPTVRQQPCHALPPLPPVLPPLQQPAWSHAQPGQPAQRHTHACRKGNCPGAATQCAVCRRNTCCGGHIGHGCDVALLLAHAARECGRGCLPSLPATCCAKIRSDC